jgi:hypothetical protein
MVQASMTHDDHNMFIVQATVDDSAKISPGCPSYKPFSSRMAK